MMWPAQAAPAEEAVPFWDNAVLDNWEIPFGEWFEIMVAWIIANLRTALDVIKWPFSLLYRNFVVGPGYHPWWEITDMSWVLVCGVVLVVASVTRNLRVGIGLSLVLAGCGLLGNEFWEETAITIGLIVVSVVMCTLIGIPMGVLCGRFDGVWRAVRPALDAMQVVHAFVYLIPVIFFFGLGSEAATMVIMVFSIPPLIRLTNLGIRQVPADVVEASRAYGASEWRVLFDVQLPLARPAIMTGLNQTLLLSISMLGVAAIMGASGLGLLVFRALTNLDIPLSASAGLALFIVAVVLDRISQTEAGRVGLFARIRRSWVHRRDPEALLKQIEADKAEAEAEEKEKQDGVLAPAGKAERAGAVAALAGAALALASVFMPWGRESGLVSGYVRQEDLDLAGQSFGGLAAEGGSFYGAAVLGLSLVVLGAALTTLLRPGRGPRWFGADGAFLASAGLAAAAGAYLWLAPAAAAAAYTDGAGAWAAMVGGAVCLAGSAVWIKNAPYSPARPLADRVSVVRIAAAAAIVGMLAAAGLSSWSVDGRASAEEMLAELTRLQESQGDQQGTAAQAVTIGTEAVIRQEDVQTNGFTAGGTRFGYLALGLGIAGFLATLPAAGVFGGGERRRWRWSLAAAALGAGVMLTAGGWIASLVRVHDDNYSSGPGAFICLMAGFFLVLSARGVIKEFRRTKVYADDPNPKDVTEKLKQA